MSDICSSLKPNASSITIKLVVAGKPSSELAISKKLSIVLLSVPNASLNVLEELALCPMVNTLPVPNPDNVIASCNTTFVLPVPAAPCNTAEKSPILASAGIVLASGSPRYNSISLAAFNCCLVGFKGAVCGLSAINFSECTMSIGVVSEFSISSRYVSLRKSN